MELKSSANVRLNEIAKIFKVGSSTIIDSNYSFKHLVLPVPIYDLTYVTLARYILN